ncbi:MAG: hypothetical protein ACXWMC_09185, partial [Syntrophales bacterium]
KGKGMPTRCEQLRVSLIILPDRQGNILFFTDGLTNHLKEIQYHHENEVGKTGNADVSVPTDAQTPDG